jgi:hypothetical protein
MVHAAEPEMVTAGLNAGCRARSGNKRITPRDGPKKLRFFWQAKVPAPSMQLSREMYKLQMLFSLLFEWNLR